MVESLAAATAVSNRPLIPKSLVDAGGVAVSGGTALARKLAAQYGNPLLVADVGAADAGSRVRAWLAPLLAAHAGEAPFRLAVGGPRESEARGIYGKVRVVMGEVVGKAGAADE